MSRNLANPCPVCTNSTGNLILDQRNNVPTLQNVALQNRDDAIHFPTGKLEIQRCAQCSFVWNAAFNPQKISYDEGYNNDVTYSGYYIEHLEAMADRIINSVPADQPIHYVEVGCGEADFLKLVVERANGRCLTAIGFDPSFTKSDSLPEGASVHTSFFGAEQLNLVPEETNVICSRHTIEHVADVQSFVQALAAPITTPSRKLFIETPDADWILKNTAFQDFFYEHCSIYTPASMEMALQAHGLSAQTTPVYGGQYMWTEAQLVENQTIAPAKATSDLAHQYIEKSTQILEEWRAFIQQRSASGPVAIWGAASKGVTFSLLLSQDENTKIACAIDLNEAKQGCYLPISGAPVLSPQHAMDMGVQSIIIMNPNYRDEIVQLAESMNWTPKFATLNN